MIKSFTHNPSAETLRVTQLNSRVLHPYEVPAITRIEASANADYIAWLDTVTTAR